MKMHVGVSRQKLTYALRFMGGQIIGNDMDFPVLRLMRDDV
jgi:hypothetical protein